jgi:hypothetical protein
MSQYKKPAGRNVYIVNPVPGGSRYTSAKQALKFVTNGQARLRPDLVGDWIEMVEIDYRHLSALACAAGQEYMPRAHSVNLLVVPSSVGTVEYSTFGRYPMFPESAFDKRTWAS